MLARNSILRESYTQLINELAGKIEQACMQLYARDERAVALNNIFSPGKSCWKGTHAITSINPDALPLPHPIQTPAALAPVPSVMTSGMQ